MTEAEIERMVVRLVGDSSQYNAMLEQAKPATASAAAVVEAAAARINQMQSNITGFARTALSALSAFGIGVSLKGAFDKFLAMEQVTLKLNAAVEISGRSAAAVVPGYVKFAESIADATTMTKGAVLGLVQQAEAQGLQDNAAKSAVKTAISIAALKGGEASSYLRVATAIQQGNTHYLRLIPGLRGVRSEAELAARAPKILASGWKQAEVVAQSTGGQIEKLKKSLGSLFVDTGALVAPAVQAVVQLATSAVKWFKSLDPSVKGVAVAAVAAMGAIVAVGPALAALAPVFSVVAAVAGAAFSWIGLAVAAVGVVVYALVQKFGGFGAVWAKLKAAGGAAWEYVKLKASEFIEYIAPAWDALVSLGAAVWEAVQAGAAEAWDALTAGWAAASELVSALWADLFGDATIDWAGVRDAVRDAFITAEFVVRNFRAVWELSTTAIAYAFVAAWNGVVFFFTDTLPAVLKWFQDEWAGIFLDVYNLTERTFTNLGGNLVRVFRELPGLIAGTTDWSEVWVPLTTGFTRLSKELKLPERVAGELEQQLKDDFEAQGAALSSSYEEFRKSKLDEFAAKHKVPENERRKAERDAFDVGSGIGRALGRGAKDSKLDAVLAGSAEALAHVLKYQEAIAGGERGRAASAPAVEAGGAEAQAHDAKSFDVLKDIRDAVREGNRRGPPVVEAAGL